MKAAQCHVGRALGQCSTSRLGRALRVTFGSGSSLTVADATFSSSRPPCPDAERGLQGGCNGRRPPARPHVIPLPIAAAQCRRANGKRRGGPRGLSCPALERRRIREVFAAFSDECGFSTPLLLELWMGGVVHSFWGGVAWVLAGGAFGVGGRGAARCVSCADAFRTRNISGLVFFLKNLPAALQQHYKLPTGS